MPCIKVIQTTIAIFCLATVGLGHVYFIEQENYNVHQFWKCRGVPSLKSQRVFTLAEAVDTYYSTLMAGRLLEDKHLDTVVPPNSILGSPHYSPLFNIALYWDENKLGNQVYMKMNCELFNDVEWVRNIYNRAFARNSGIVRAILDIIYRLSLCIRNIDTHLNCPDVCSTMPPDFCSKLSHTTGLCSSYLDEQIKSVMPVSRTSTDDYKGELNTLRKQVSNNRRMARLFYTIGDRFDIHEIQAVVARTAFCPCKMYYRYDRFLDGCVDISQEIGCGESNPCANGGRCLTALVTVVYGTDDVREVPEIKCECPPAFRGDLCQIETDRCVEENSCGEYNCLRDPHDMEHGFRCICPPSHKRKSPGEPQCVALPACGERLEDDDFGGLVISNPAATRNPCLNKGKCIQNEDPTMYSCICQPGYSGENCEIEPPTPSWGPWSTWSECIWPEPYEVCYKRPFQQQIRQCVTYTPGQRCIGSPRRQLHSNCDLTMSSRGGSSGITLMKRERLRKAAELCELSGHVMQSAISEQELGEQLFSIDAVDDWSTVGLEDAPYLNLPSSLRHGDLQAVNWPRAEDLLFITLWIYAVMLHLALILLWIYYIHKWRTHTPATSKFH